jgi:uncharacterized membrane protein
MQSRIKKALVTCTTSNTTNRVFNNDDIYVNNGNVELRLPKAPIKPVHLQQQSSTIEQESTKVEAESDRGGGALSKLQPRKLKIKKSRVGVSIDKKMESGLNTGT